MVLGSPVKRRAVKGPLEKAGLAGVAAVAVAAAALLLLLCAASLRCSAAFGSALAAAPRKLWAGGVSVAAEAAAAETGRKVAAVGRSATCSTGNGCGTTPTRCTSPGTAPFLDVGFRCSENGRPDSSYTKWRWQAIALRSPKMLTEDRIQTLSDWIHKEVNTSKTHVIYRTYAPVHFRGGDWNTGGSCHLETLPDVAPLTSLQEWADLLQPVNDFLGDNLRPKLHGVNMLNVTQMTAQRKDGHLSVYLSPSGPVARYKQDCSHWCLPGVPDTWNELLYALFMKRQMKLDQNVSLAGTETLSVG
ncbi:hypothetical protein PR202_gb00548 [Eleusine coracana subsp. coracana]|uniref:Trichome birefringence-like N-terminal domain-containing protein n=1 Tax=Eleusine coracana subsp. coracana TaxID=191504 RepID=A0AAV5DTM3_ELECO|nr:hypothetical protein PR202_gb00548 [Eleusine coracana subsp. coracana]